MEIRVLISLNTASFIRINATKSTPQQLKAVRLHWLALIATAQNMNSSRLHDYVPQTDLETPNVAYMIHMHVDKACWPANFHKNR